MFEKQAIAEGKYASIIEALKEKRYKDAEREAITEVKAHPTEAQGWVLLGEALLQQGIGLTAAHIFERAWLLDPEAVWVGAVQKALGEIKNPTARYDIEELLHVKPVTITGAVLVKNEERLIEKCLKHLAAAVDEILVIDTGSTDRTVEIAENMPKVRVIHYPWQDDFAAARNAGLAQITTDWVLWVDGDEILFPEDAPHVRTMAGLFNGSLYPPILYIWQSNSIEGKVVNDLSQARMFAMKRGLHYTGKVHEQVTSAEKGLFSDNYFSAMVRLRVQHDGYEPTIIQQKNKLERNLKLLEQMVIEDADNPGWWFFYGRETLATGNREKALELLHKAEALAENQPRFGRMTDIQMLLVKIHLPLNQLEEAEAACHKALSIHPNFPDASFFLAQIQLRRAVDHAREAEKNILKAKQDFASYRGNVSADHQIAQWKADVILADLACLNGKLPEAQQIYKHVLKKFPDMQELQDRLISLENIGRQLVNDQKL
jgi:cytochrome c-type biogenesis protein CcmH/NrfG